MSFDGARPFTVEFEWGRPGSQVVGGLHVVRHSQMDVISQALVYDVVISRHYSVPHGRGEGGGRRGSRDGLQTVVVALLT